MEDDYHPSPTGSFLAACTILETIAHFLDSAPHKAATVTSGQNRTSAPEGGGASLFSRSRRPLADGQPSNRIPSNEEIEYLKNIAEGVAKSKH